MDKTQEKPVHTKTSLAFATVGGILFVAAFIYSMYLNYYYYNALFDAGCKFAVFAAY
jgi:hypothetical protein